MGPRGDERVGGHRMKHVKARSREGEVGLGRNSLVSFLNIRIIGKVVKTDTRFYVVCVCVYIYIFIILFFFLLKIYIFTIITQYISWLLGGEIY